MLRFRSRLAAFGFAALLVCLWSVARLKSQTPANESPAQKPVPAQNPVVNDQPAPASPATANPVPSSQPVTDPGEGPAKADSSRGNAPADKDKIELSPDIQRQYPLSANVSTPQDPNAFHLSSNVDRVLLDVSVKDSNGGFVSGLTKENFKVFDNGKEQQVRWFDAGDIPVTLGLVVDNSGSMRPKRPEVVTAALTFVTASNPNDQMFVVNFNDSVRLGLPPSTPFTDDRNVLRDALLRNPVQGRTAMNDGIREALLHLQKGKYYKKALILISDGGDNASELTTDDVIRLAEESQATLYTIGIYDEDDKDRNPGVLKRLANISGGESFLPERLTDLPGVCAKIAKDIRNRYSIGYAPSDLAFDGKVRTIRVVASAPDHGKLLVRSRTRYLPPPPNGQATEMAAKPARKHR